jgi:serine/threonine protein kinase
MTFESILPHAGGISGDVLFFILFPILAGLAAFFAGRACDKRARRARIKGTADYPMLDFANIIEEGAYIGSGVSASVHEATWGSTPCAIKKMTKKLDDTADRASLVNELSILSAAGCFPNVISVLGTVSSPYHNIIVMELMPNGSVFDLMQSSRSVTPKLKARMLRDAANGLKHLHDHGIIHGDLAARNLLIDSEWRVNITDFGSSRCIEDGSAVVTIGEAGPVRWMPPESLTDRILATYTDIFSFGVVLYEVYSRRVPWEHLDKLDIIMRVSSGETLEMPPGTPERVLRLSATCFRFVAGERPSADRVLEECTTHADETFGKKMYAPG